MLASLYKNDLKDINALKGQIRIPDPLPWSQIATPLARAEDAVARLDERLAKSPIRSGWIARTDFTDAVASLWLDGERVDLEDLVLHDAGMDIQPPTPDLARAHMILRTRRRVAAGLPGWALSPSGLASLRGRAGESDRVEPVGDVADEIGVSVDLVTAGLADLGRRTDTIRTGSPARADLEEEVADAVISIDRLLARTDRMLAGAIPDRPGRDPRLYDLDWDEDGRLADWHRVVAETAVLPPTLGAALVLDAWETIEPLQHMPWLGRLLASALLRGRAKTRAHLLCLNVGLRAIPREQRRARNQASRIVAQLQAIAAAADLGLAEHDRWMTARLLLERKLTGRRSTSRLPALVDYVLSRPLVSAGMIAEAIGVTPRAAQDLVVDLGLREMTGRGRYRAWGVL